MSDRHVCYCNRRPTVSAKGQPQKQLMSHKWKKTWQWILSTNIAYIQWCSNLPSLQGQLKAHVSVELVEWGSPVWIKYILNKNINATCNNFKDFTQLQFIWVNQPIEINSIGPNLWILHDLEYRYASVGHRYLTKKVGALIRKPDSISCDQHLPHAGKHISFA